MDQPFQKANFSADLGLKNLSFTGKYWWGEERAKFYAEQLMPIIEKNNSIIHLIPAPMKPENNDNQFHQKLQQFLPDNYCKIYTWKTPFDYFKLLMAIIYHNS